MSNKVTKKRAKKIKGCTVILETGGGSTCYDTYTIALKNGADYVRHNGVEIPVDAGDDENSLDVKRLYLLEDRNCDLYELMKKYHRMSQQQKVNLWLKLSGR